MPVGPEVTSQDGLLSISQWPIRFWVLHWGHHTSELKLKYGPRLVEVQDYCAVYRVTLCPESAFRCILVSLCALVLDQYLFWSGGHGGFKLYGHSGYVHNANSACWVVSCVIISPSAHEIGMTLFPFLRWGNWGTGYVSQSHRWHEVELWLRKSDSGAFHPLLSFFCWIPAPTILCTFPLRKWECLSS